MSETENERIFGLDLLRSIAILIVVIGHSSFLIDNYTDFPFIILPDGVDLFFVLSGYLIGGIILKIVNNNYNLMVVLNFLQRRWFRTLPNYFLFLLLNIILIGLGLIEGYLNKYTVTYLLFFQNFHKPYDFLFWESWSLSVEEWFYFSFPFLIYFLYKIKIRKRYSILSVIVFFLLFSLIYRINQSLTQNLDWDLYFRKLVLTRLDTIAYGLLAAYLHWYHKDFWERTKNISFCLGMIFLFLLIRQTDYSPFFKDTFYFSFIGISILLILPKLVSWKNNTLFSKQFEFISKISYSMYLAHMPLVYILGNSFVVSNGFEAMLLYIFYWGITIFISYLNYKYFEVPIMNIRERMSSKLLMKNI